MPQVYIRLHRWIYWGFHRLDVSLELDTTLGYAWLYDGTIAADYYRAMSQVERLFHLPESRQTPFYTPAELVALVDSLGSGTLNAHQRETVQALREGILSLEVKV